MTASPNSLTDWRQRVLDAKERGCVSLDEVNLARDYKTGPCSSLKIPKRESGAPIDKQLSWLLQEFILHWALWVFGSALSTLDAIEARYRELVGVGA